MPRKKSAKSTAKKSSTKTASPSTVAATPSVSPASITPESLMTDSPAWSLVFIQGILTLLLGWFLLLKPVVTVLALVQVMGLFWVISGIISVARAFMQKDKSSGWGWTVVSGVIGIIAGMIVLNNQLFAAVLTPTLLLYMIAVSFMFDGIIKMIWGKRSLDSMGYERSWGSFLVGVFYLLLGVSLIAMPLISGIAILVLTAGWLATFSGILLIVAAFQIRKYQHSLA